jgi:hypothetical protein
MNKQVNKQGGTYMDNKIDDMVSGGIKTVNAVIQGKGEVADISASERMVSKMLCKGRCF